MGSGSLPPMIYDILSLQVDSELSSLKKKLETNEQEKEALQEKLNNVQEMLKASQVIELCLSNFLVSTANEIGY